MFSNSFKSLSPRFYRDSCFSQYRSFSRCIKKFWKQVHLIEAEHPPLTGGYMIYLDQNPLKYPDGEKLLLPNYDTALLVAAEWEMAEEIRPELPFPFTSLIHRTRDQQIRGRKDDITRLLNYLHSDTICYHQNYPEGWVKLQEKHWLPIIKGLEERHKVNIYISEDILPRRQSTDTIEKFQRVMESLNPWHFAALTCASMTSKSVLIGMAMIDGQLDGRTATEAARLEATYQTQFWGKMKESHDLDEAYLKILLTSANVFLKATQSLATS